MSQSFSARFFIAQQAYDRRLGRRASDAEFAAALGVSPASLSAYKNSIEPPRHERIVEIARACGVDPGWLAYGSLSAAPIEKDWPKSADDSNPPASTGLVKAAKKLAVGKEVKKQNPKAS